MDVELTEIQEFLVGFPPFEALPQSALVALPKALTVRYYRRGSEIIGSGAPNHEMYILRSGAVEVRTATGAFVDRLDPGSSFGWSAILEGGVSPFAVSAIEDSLTLVMPGEVFSGLREQYPTFAAFYARSHAGAMRSAVRVLQDAENGRANLRTRVGDLVRRQPLWAPPDTTVAAAARLMTSERVSSLLVIDGPQLVGIVTDRDLRGRVLAVGLDPSRPLHEIMTADPVTAQADDLAFELLLTMVSRNIHHVPVVADDGAAIGLVSSTDLMRLQQSNPIYLVGEIAKMTSVTQLAEVSPKLRNIVAQLVTQDASADDIGRVVTAIGDAVERRLLQLGEKELGPPPAAYCWVVLGSAARLEQGLSSDQDNALILADDAGPEARAYVEKLARFVSDGLAGAGYAYCDGDVMATNPAWRQTLAEWKDTFSTWIAAPVPKALLNVSIFFDMRPIHGDAALFTELQHHVLTATKGNARFLSLMTQDATDLAPPIGFFRGFVLEKEGEHDDTLNLKRKGTALIVDAARVYALAQGLPQVNTQARIAALAHTHTLGQERIDELSDALEFIAYVRLRHQARLVRDGLEPDNFVPPTELSAFERRHLREAFQIVRSTQGLLSSSYTSHYRA